MKNRQRTGEIRSDSNTINRLQNYHLKHWTMTLNFFNVKITSLYGNI